MVHRYHCRSNRVLKCDVIKMKFLKSWDLSGYSERTMSKSLLAKNQLQKNHGKLRSTVTFHLRNLTGQNS